MMGSKGKEETRTCTYIATCRPLAPMTHPMCSSPQLIPLAHPFTRLCSYGPCKTHNAFKDHNNAIVLVGTKMSKRPTTCTYEFPKLAMTTLKKTMIYFCTFKNDMKREGEDLIEVEYCMS